VKNIYYLYFFKEFIIIYTYDFNKNQNNFNQNFVKNIVHNVYVFAQQMTK